MGSYVDVKVAHIEVEERHPHGVLVIGEGIDLVAGSVEVYLVVAIDIRYGGMKETGGVKGPVNLCLQSLTKSQG